MVRVVTALFGHQVQNDILAVIKKIFLQALVEVIFRYHGSGTPWGPPTEKPQVREGEGIGVNAV